MGGVPFDFVPDSNFPSLAKGIFYVKFPLLFSRTFIFFVCGLPDIISSSSIPILQWPPSYGPDCSNHRYLWGKTVQANTMLLFEGTNHFQFEGKLYLQTAFFQGYGWLFDMSAFWSFLGAFPGTIRIGMSN